MDRMKQFWGRQSLCTMMALSMLPLLFGRGSQAVENGSTEYYKMLSSVEYSGKTQFKNQVETLLTVTKQLLSDNKVLYFISSNDFDLAANNLDLGQQPSPRGISFLIDRGTGYLSGAGNELALLEELNNHCVEALKTATRQNIGKTWKQSFQLLPLSESLPNQLTLTLTAIQSKTKAFGEMIAVRALSEPFFVKAAKINEGVGGVKSRIGAVYLFDQEIEDIYLSVSVFEATTDMNGFSEKLRHEVATYKSDANGVSVDLTGLAKDFEKLVRKVGLAKKSIEVVNQAPAPQWVQSEALAAAKVAHVCAAIACEGAPNPVALIYIAVAQTVAQQTVGTLLSVGTVGVISSTLAASVTGVGAMKIAAAPALMGMGLGTAGAVAGGTVGAIAIAGGFDDDDEKARSPSQP